MGVCYTSPHRLFHYSYIQMHVSYRCHEDVNNVPWIAAGHELSLMSAVWSDFWARFLLSCILAGCCSEREREREIESEWKKREREISLFYSNSLFLPPRLKTSKPSIWVSCSGRDGFWCVRNNLAPTAHTFFSIASYMKHSKWHGKKSVIITLGC